MCYAFPQKQESLGETQKIKQFGLVWGLMKYHHPVVSKGAYDWDSVFVTNFKKLEEINAQDKFSRFLLEFIEVFESGRIKTSKKAALEFKKNYDYNWIEQYRGSSMLYSKLCDLRDNTNIKSHYVGYAKFTSIPTFKNERGFEKFDPELKSHRLLSFFSFWNVIQYYDVNKYLMDENWFDQLDKFIIAFMASETLFEYEKVKSNLFSQLNDSHSFYISKVVSDSLLAYKPPFATQLVNDTLVVTRVFNISAKEKNLELGDQIYEINGTSIQKNIEEKVSPFISVSNKSRLKRWANWVLFSNEQTIEVKIKRGESNLKETLHLHENFTVENSSGLNHFTVSNKWDFIEEDIGYINLEVISKKEIKTAFKKFSDSKGIVIDLRNYPKNISIDAITKELYPKKKKFLSILSPIPTRPSFSEFDKSPLKFIKSPFKTGSNNPNYYKGIVALLVDHTTISRGEYFGLAIQASPNCITIGEDTAGSPMNVAQFTLPDNSEILFTSLGSFYPDSTPVQRNGLKIDHYIHETTSNFLEDQYIKTAKDLIKSNK